MSELIAGMGEPEERGTMLHSRKMGMKADRARERRRTRGWEVKRKPGMRIRYVRPR